MIGIRITRHAFPDCGEWTVWKPMVWYTPFFSKGQFGTIKCKRAKMLLRFGNVGLFYTYGKEWIQ